MRRLIFCLSALSVLGLAVGCHHTAGSCDCVDLPPWAKPKAKAEPIKEMPKEAPSAKEAAPEKELAPPKDKAEADPADSPAGP